MRDRERKVITHRALQSLDGIAGALAQHAQSTLERLTGVTPDEACAHPRWVMGRKISVDSATLMNKGLELIEAQLLFGLPPGAVEVLVHPESIVHSLVELNDGSVIAQLGVTDMRLPIQLALLHPERVSGPAKRLDWRTLSALHFEQPDRDTFAALNLGFEVARRGGTCGAEPPGLRPKRTPDKTRVAGPG